MIKTIVVGSDGSEHGRHAVEWAAQTARQLGAEVILVHAAATFPPLLAYGGGLVQYPSQEVVDEQRVALEKKVATELAAPLIAAGIKWQARVLEGEPVRVLQETAQEHGAQLIVVGTRALNGVEELFVGSTSHSLTRHSRIPVAVVPLSVVHMKRNARATGKLPVAV